MSEPTATIPQIAETAQFLGTSPARTSTVLSILAHVGYNPQSTLASTKAVSIVDRSTNDTVSAHEIRQFLLGLLPVTVWPVMALNPAVPCVSRDCFVGYFVEVLKLAQAPLGHRRGACSFSCPAQPTGGDPYDPRADIAEEEAP